MYNVAAPFQKDQLKFWVMWDKLKCLKLPFFCYHYAALLQFWGNLSQNLITFILSPLHYACKVWKILYIQHFWTYCVHMTKGRLQLPLFSFLAIKSFCCHSTKWQAKQALQENKGAFIALRQWLGNKTDLKGSINREPRAYIQTRLQWQDCWAEDWEALLYRTDEGADEGHLKWSAWGLNWDVRQNKQWVGTGKERVARYAGCYGCSICGNLSKN